MRGIPLEPTTAASVDSYILAAVLLLLILLAYNSRHIGRIFQSFFHDVWTIRERENVFEERVASENQALLLLILLTSVLEGVFLGTLMEGIPEIQAFIICGSLAFAFNIFSLIACSLVGYTFTTPNMAMQWRRGLLASQAMLGFLLIIPAMILLLRPGIASTTITIAAVLYILTRMLYIIKGIRIFLDELYSWIYFILYLCTLEIIPLLVMWRLMHQIEKLM